MAEVYKFCQKVLLNDFLPPRKQNIVKLSTFCEILWAESAFIEGVRERVRGLKEEKNILFLVLFKKK
jgi:hypothetical protein